MASAGRSGMRGAAHASVAATLLTLAGAGCMPPGDVYSVQREQHLLARRVADTRADIEQLRNEVADLRGAIESRSGRQRDERYGSYSARSSGPPPEVRASRPPDPTVPGTTIDPTTGEPLAAIPREPPPFPPEEADFHRGVEEHRRGEYQPSIESLKGYLRNHPKGAQAAEAQYLIGEATFAQGKYNEAILEFAQVLVAWPDHPRVPSALLREGEAFANIGDKEDAKLIFQKVIADHPQSAEADRARQKLQALSGA